MAAVAPTTLEDVRDRYGREIFPTWVLDDCKRALILFAAGFHGKQDAFWIAEAGIRATCVDTDVKRLREMIPLYPKTWTFRNMDAYEYARTCAPGYDLVTLDPWSGQMQDVADALPLWCKAAGKTVVLGTLHNTSVEAPDGWGIAERLYRSSNFGGVYWTVLTRA